MKIDGPSIHYYTLHCFGPTVMAAFSGRKYTAEKRGEFLDEIGVNPNTLQLLKQVHGNRILKIEEVLPVIPENGAPEADGMITSLRGLTLGVLTADCLPVFFWSAKPRVIAVAHAGWRGLYKQILAAMIHRFQTDYGVSADRIKVALGPGIRECCYEVGEEFKDYFPSHFKPSSEKAGKSRIDLPAVARDQLMASGIRPAYFFDTMICGSCRVEKLFSARREKTAERILSVIRML